MQNYNLALYDPAAPSPDAVEARYWRGMARRLRRIIARHDRQAERDRARRERVTLIWALVASVVAFVAIGWRLLA